MISQAHLWCEKVESHYFLFFKKEKRKKKEKEKKDRKQKLLIRFSLMPNITNQSNTLIFLIIWYLGGRI